MSQFPIKFVFFFVVFFGFYLYLSDQLSKNETRSYINSIFEPALGNNSNHTVIKMVAEYKNVFAAVVSSTCVTVLASLPVFNWNEKKKINLLIFFILRK